MYHWLQPAYINRKCIVIVQLFFIERAPTKFVLDSAAALYGFFSLFGPNFRSILLLTWNVSFH